MRASLLIALALLLTPSQRAWAQQDVLAAQRRLQDDLTTQRAVAIARERRVADERELALLAQLDARDTALRSALRAAQASRTEVSAARMQLDAVVAERQRLVDVLTERDRLYAAEVAEFRRQMAGLTSTASADVTEALERFADGDRVGAFPVIDRLVRAENAAAARATALRSAARLRELAGLAALMRETGEKTTGDVIAIWEEAQRLDAGDHAGWLELSRLFRDAGTLERSRGAAERALDTAVSDEQRARALLELGRVLPLVGDLPGARARLESALVLYERGLAAAPDSIGAQRELSVGLEALGDVLNALGNLPGALERYTRMMVIRMQVAVQSRTPIALRDAMIALERLGDVGIALGDIATARGFFEQSVRLAEEVLSGTPTSVRAQRDLSVSVDRLGNVDLLAGDTAAARGHYERALQVREQLARLDPTAEARRDVSVSRVKIGDTLMAAEREDDARPHFEAALTLREAIAAESPESAQATRDVLVVLQRLGDALMATGDASSARAYYERSLRLAQALSDATPSDAEARRDVIVNTLRMGEVLVALNDRAAARTQFERAVERAEQQAVRVLTEDAQRDVMVSAQRLGDVLESMGDPASARTQYERALAVSERLANQSGSTRAHRDLVTSYVKMARVTNVTEWWRKALAKAEELQATGRLTPADAGLVDSLRREVARQP